MNKKQTHRPTNSLDGSIKDEYQSEADQSISLKQTGALNLTGMLQIPKNNRNLKTEMNAETRQEPELNMNEKDETREIKFPK